MRLPDVGEWPLASRLSREREALGFFITGHPVEDYLFALRKMQVTALDRLGERPTEEGMVRIAGMVSAHRQILTKRGDKMAFVTLEDMHGTVECVFFSEPWAQSRAVVTSELPILVAGKLEKGADGTPKVLAESARSLDEVQEGIARRVIVVLRTEELDDARLDGLQRLLSESKGGCPVMLHLSDDAMWAQHELGPDWRVVPDRALRQGAEALFRRPGVIRLA